MPGRPIRSLVAEDRSAGGVRDRTGPDPTPSKAAMELGHLGATAEGSAADNHGHSWSVIPAGQQRQGAAHPGHDAMAQSRVPALATPPRVSLTALSRYAKFSVRLRVVVRFADHGTGGGGGLALTLSVAERG
jgi:hypothetical protein